MPLLYSIAHPLADTATDQNHLKELLTEYCVVDSCWNWEQIVHQHDPGYTRHTFYLVCNNSVQGALHAKFPKQSQLSSDSELVYVDFIATAPWNRNIPGHPKQFSGIGTKLMIYVMQFSQSAGYSGIIGLHSLKQAEDFYRAMEMVELGHDESYGNMLYFEMPTNKVAKHLPSQNG